MPPFAVGADGRVRLARRRIGSAAGRELLPDLPDIRDERERVAVVQLGARLQHRRDRRSVPVDGVRGKAEEVEEPAVHGEPLIKRNRIVEPSLLYHTSRQVSSGTAALSASSMARACAKYQRITSVSSGCSVRPLIVCRYCRASANTLVVGPSGTQRSPHVGLLPTNSGDHPSQSIPAPQEHDAIGRGEHSLVER